MKLKPVMGRKYQGKSPRPLKPERPKQSLSIHAGNNPKQSAVCRTCLYQCNYANTLIQCPCVYNSALTASVKQ